MNLTPEEVERFYAIWKPLILFVNRRLRLVPDMLSADLAGPWDPHHVLTIRDALWADDALREAFVAENPAGLPAEDLAMVESWRHRRAGAFYILRHLKKHSLFLEEKAATVYAVLGLASPLDEIVPFVPCYAKTVLLPFGDRIIYDSLMVPYNITFGRGIRNRLEDSYRDAKERGAVVTSLLPADSVGREEREGDDRSTNTRVLEAFRTHLFRSGLSPKVVERDLANVAAFAEEYLLARPEPLSLREFSSDNVSGYVAQVRASAALTEARRRETLTSLKRFLRFLRDTDRMDYDAAEYALDVIKGRE
jgi:hypothetical protein